MIEEKRISARLPFRIPESDVLSLIHDCRRIYNIDPQIVITLPESPSGGGWETRPHSQGGPDVFITITVLEQYRDSLQKFLEKLLKTYEWEGSVEQLTKTILIRSL